jgi:hypothetical protein
MLWAEAVTYCENLGGRLPTISELRTLIKNCPATETDGACKVKDDCLSLDDCWDDACDGCGSDPDDLGKYSVFGDIYYLWSSSEPSGSADFAWDVPFFNGGVSYYGKNSSLNDFVRCVK